MKRLLPLIGALVFSAHCFAGIDNTQITSAIQNGLHTGSNPLHKSLSIVYSGKDISRSEIAVADERTAAIQPKLIG